MKTIRLGMVSLVMMLLVLGLGGTPVFGAYVDNGDGTVIDTGTGLMLAESRRQHDSKLGRCRRIL
jgi:hypothetical protein